MMIVALRPSDASIIGVVKKGFQMTTLQRGH
jgi:hypothetical protein